MDRPIFFADVTGGCSDDCATLPGIELRVEDKEWGLDVWGDVRAEQAAPTRRGAVVDETGVVHPAGRVPVGVAPRHLLWKRDRGRDRGAERLVLEAEHGVRQRQHAHSTADALGDIIGVEVGGEPARAAAGPQEVGGVLEPGGEDAIQQRVEQARTAVVDRLASTRAVRGRRYRRVRVPRPAAAVAVGSEDDRVVRERRVGEELRTLVLIHVRLRPGRRAAEPWVPWLPRCTEGPGCAVHVGRTPAAALHEHDPPLWVATLDEISTGAAVEADSALLRRRGGQHHPIPGGYGGQRRGGCSGGRGGARRQQGGEPERAHRRRNPRDPAPAPAAHEQSTTY